MRRSTLYSHKPSTRCECADRQCPAHTGNAPCNDVTLPKSVLYRIDMEDSTGTVMCEPCADDAMESGLFTLDDDDSDDDADGAE